MDRLETVMTVSIFIVVGAEEFSLVILVEM